MYEKVDLHGLSRKEFLRRGAAAGGVVLGGSLLAACGGGGGGATEAAGGGATTAASTGAAAGTTAAAGPKKGGVLRVGVGGGGSNDQIDAAKATNQADFSRTPLLYSSLFDRDPEFNLVLNMAEEVTSNDAADEWTVRLKEGVEFHNGKPLTVDDFVFSIERNFDKKLGYSQFTAPLSNIGFDLKNGVTKMDERTVRFKLMHPYAIFKDVMVADIILPVGYDPKNPVGTGPFKFKSFAPGQQSVFDAFENYGGAAYGGGAGPYVDQVVIIDFADDTARVNALLSGQVDVINAVPYGQIPVLKGNDQLQVLIEESGLWRPITMRVDTPPFDDNRVREAFRWIVDRDQMVAQAIAGNGRIGNDLYSPQDPCFASELPQRTQDIEKAKSLLKAAGKEGLTVEMTTSPVNGGVVEMSEVFVQQAKAAGVTVKLNRVDPGTFYGDQYLKWTFAVDWWGTSPYLIQVGTADGPGGTWNETHFADPTFGKLYHEALQTADDTKRCDLSHEMQKIQYDTGGYIISYFPNTIDAATTKTTGWQPWSSGAPYNGSHLELISFT